MCVGFAGGSVGTVVVFVVSKILLAVTAEVLIPRRKREIMFMIYTCDEFVCILIEFMSTRVVVCLAMMRNKLQTVK